MKWDFLIRKVWNVRAARINVRDQHTSHVIDAFNQDSKTISEWDNRWQSNQNMRTAKLDKNRKAAESMKYEADWELINRSVL